MSRRRSSKPYPKITPRQAATVERAQVILPVTPPSYWDVLEPCIRDRMQAGVNAAYARAGARFDNLLDGLVGGNNTGHAGGGWSNHVTGMGTFGRDKVMQASFQESFRIDDPQLTAMFNGNDLCQRIVMDPVKEMFRRGWTLVVPQDSDPENPETPAQTGESEQPVGGESGPAAPGAPLVDPMGADPASSSATPPPQTPDRDASGAKGAPPVGNDYTSRTAPPARGAGNSDLMGEDLQKPVGPASAKTPTNGVMTQKSIKSLLPPTAGGPKTAADKATTQSKGADLAKLAEKYAAARHMKPRCRESAIFGALYGGGLMIVGADDGQPMDTPLQEDQIKTIRYFTWMDRRFIFASTWYAEIGPKFGEPETYEIINPFGGQTNTRVHESRVIRFDGQPVDFLMRRRLLGWTLSVLQAPYDVLRQFDQSFQSISNLMTDMAQAVMKMQGLAQMIASDPVTLQTRMTMVDMARSSGRMLFIDAENEEFGREQTPVSGVADLIDRQMLRVAAAASMPVSRVFGRQPSGLNATGDADIRMWYDQIAGKQKEDLEPKLRRIYNLIFLAKDGPTGGTPPEKELEFTWHKLYAPSELEQSQIRWNMAQADDKYITNKALLPEEVAVSRFRNGELCLETEINMKLREEALLTVELPPSGAEQADQEQKNKESELAISASTAAAKGAPPGKGGPPKPGAKKPPARADAWDEARFDSPASDVVGMMSEDFPPEALEWVPDQAWRGPQKVSLTNIDYSNRKKWHASKKSEHDRVEQFAQMIEDGDEGVKPIVLIQPPKGKAIIVDGHHRALAYRRAGKNKATVYVAKVKEQTGPWDETHAMQRSGPSGLSGSDE